MSSSPDDKKPTLTGASLGRGRGRSGRFRSPSPRVVAGFVRPSESSKDGSGSDDGAAGMSIARPGSNSPPQTVEDVKLIAGMENVGLAEKVLTPEEIEKAEQDSRGAKRGTRPEDTDYSLVTRPKHLLSKYGVKGTVAHLIANYFKLNKGPMWQLHGYHVYFEPEEDRLFVKKYILRSKKDVIGAYIFNGMELYTSKVLEKEALHFNVEKKEGGITSVTLKPAPTEPVPGDPTYINFYRLILRKCLFGMDLEEMGRHFYDRNEAITLPTQRLVLWPGYVTTLRQHERDVMLCVEVTHKVLRLDNVLTIIRNIQDTARGNPTQAVLDELKDTIVMTSYNRKTYKIEDVDFNLTPKSTFDCKGVTTAYFTYFKDRYSMEMTDPRQPMLICKPSKKDMHRGFTGNVILCPEFCQLTGLTDAMRANFTLMKELSKHLHMGPGDRIKAINNFMRRLRSKPELTEELSKWGLEFESQLVPLQGRVLGRETMYFATGSEMADDKADWTKAFRTQKMLSVINMNKWAVIVPQRDFPGVENLCRTMTKVATPLNMNIRNPCEVFKLPDIKQQTYMLAMNTLLQKYTDLQMLFVILPNNKLETYSTVKKRLAVDKGVLSQCFVAKNVTSKGLMSIATKVVVQMNAKLGGEPWTIKLPLKNMMVLGYDVYHGAKGSKGGSVGAMVSSLSPTYAKYYSTTSIFNNPDELNKTMRSDFTKCCHAYQRANGFLPDRIMMFRDGVGEGQLTQVFEVELEQIREAMKDLYLADNLTMPKFTFIIVTKKIDTRLFADIRGKMDNPVPGTIVDTVVTIPDRYDFFLISCAARQGTVSPCCYNVIYDDTGLEPDRVQLITYKMCHMYFNWSGTVAVPAPCQYAHKLAFITGTAYCGQASQQLSNLLHFL